VAQNQNVRAATERMAGTVRVMSVQIINHIVVRPRIGKMASLQEHVLTKGVAIAVKLTTANQTTLPLAMEHGKSVALVLVNHRIPVVIHPVTSARSVTEILRHVSKLKLNMLAAIERTASMVI